MSKNETLQDDTSAFVAVMITFPKVTDPMDLIMGALTKAEIAEWKQKAEEANYDRKFATMASDIFFEGGALIPRDDITEEQFRGGVAYLKKWLSSFDPKHETKTLVAGFILSQIATGFKD